MSAPLRERRLPVERRRSLFRALWRGNFERRRIAPRRNSERHAVVTDWFHPQWLAVGMLIMLLCGADALLTVTLIAHGADEINPLMAPLIESSVDAFAAWKFGLTAVGVVFLTLLARLQFFGRTVGIVLYLVLGLYATLVAYELFLLRNIPLD
ncbi:MAG TPA: DUF5658 family protein [Steroidobacteraceae bacterium]|nr:DUF5658 family protein [Steroidobacteraceae bacterium]